MDFVYDLTEKLQEQNIDYFLVTIRKGEKSNSADVFYKLTDEDSANSLGQVLLKISDQEEIEGILNKDANESSKSKKPKKARGRPRKKKRDDNEEE
jgi:hypothetical protein